MCMYAHEVSTVTDDYGSQSLATSQLNPVKLVCTAAVAAAATALVQLQDVRLDDVAAAEGTGDFSGGSGGNGCGCQSYIWVDACDYLLRTLLAPVPSVPSHS